MGRVPTLRIVNRGEQPVLLVDGEHLVGVKQNRILNTTILVPEKSSLDIPVSCVEAGRWGVPQGGAQPSSPHLFTSARAKKAEAVTASVRSSGVFVADQAAIWEDVDRKLSDLGVQSPAGRLDCPGTRMGEEGSTGSDRKRIEAGAVLAVPLLERLLPEVPGPHDDRVFAVVAIVALAKGDVLEPVLPVQGLGSEVGLAHLEGDPSRTPPHRLVDEGRK